ncbi:transcriptional regulator, partial [Klebsiella pneumoniae]|nr:transcriptional regulator [Klebsiella pneumoniae]
REAPLPDRSAPHDTRLFPPPRGATALLSRPADRATRSIDRQRRQPLRKLVLQAADGRELAPADITIAIPLNA